VSGYANHYVIVDDSKNHILSIAFRLIDDAEDFATYINQFSSLSAEVENHAHNGYLLLDGEVVGTGY
jgi:hypothetical protein